MNILKLILTFLLIFTLMACSSEQAPDQSSISATQNNGDLFEVRGVVTKGPINNASLEIIAFDPNDGSESGAPLVTTNTDANGNWTVSITPAPTDPLLIKASGGTFIDESDPEPVLANKRRITFGPAESLYGVLLPGFNSASVNILTNALIEKSRTEAAGSNFLNVLGNNRNIASSAIGFDPFTVAAANPLTPAQTASTDAIEYAMYLGGIATALNSAAIKLGVAQPTYNIVDGLVRDLSDGTLNGINQAGVVNVLVNSVSVSFPADLDLNAAIRRFRNNNYAAYAVTPVSDVVSVNVALMQTSGVNNSPSAIDDVYATVQDTPIITGNVLSNDSDPDGDALSISAFTQSANGTVVNNDDGSFTFTPTAGFTGNAIFSYTVDDNKGGLDTAQVVIAVTTAPGNGGGNNNPPTAEAGTAIIVDEGATVALNGSGTDSDGSISAYQWTQIGTSTVTLVDAAMANASFTAPAVATGISESLIFQLTVTDDDSDTGVDFVTVTVNSTQSVSTNFPVADAGQDQSVNEQTGVTLDASGSTDSDGSIVSYSWTQTGGSPTVTLVNPGTVQASFVGPNILADTTLTFFVIVTDNDGNSSTDSIDVTMIADPNVTNDDPVAVTDNVTTPQGITLQSIPVTANDTDLNLDPIILVGITQPPNGTAINNGDGTVTYIPNLAFSGVDSFTYSVIDGQGGSDTGDVNITVDPDSDGDGLLDSNETAIGLDPLDADYDNDGFYDGHELLISGTAAFLNTETPPGTVISTGNANNTIGTDTTWNLANSPYWVQTDVNVQGGATLTIESGVVVKFDSGTDLFVNTSGSLIVQGNAPLPQNVRFTSIFDDSLNGDTGGVVGTPAASNWQGIDFQANSAGSLEHLSVRYAVDCISISNSSPSMNGIEVGDCGSYGIYTYSSATSITSQLHNLTVTDFDSNNIATANTAVLFQATNSTTNTLDASNLNINEAGQNTNDYGIWIYAQSNANISGSVDQVTISDSSSYGIYVNNIGTGTVDPDLSNIDISTPENNTVANLYINNTAGGILTAQFDGTNLISGGGGTSSAGIRVDNSAPVFADTGSWSISNVGYGMILINADGQINNITMDNTLTAGLELGGASDPTVFSNIVLTNAPSPYELLGQDITSTISAGYDYSDASVNKSYIRLNGTLLADMSLGPDPLNNSGNSVWRVTSNLTVPAGTTLTIEDGAVLKFNPGLILYIDGSLVVGDGDGLGSNAVLTSILDDSVGGDTNGDSTATSPSWNDWNSIRPRAGSVVDIDNATIGYSSYGIYHYNVQSTSLDISNTDVHDVYYYGIQLGLFSSQSLTMNLDTVSFTDIGVNTSYHGIYANIDTTASLGGTWNNVTLNNIGGSGIYIDDSSSAAVDPTISGLTIGDSGTVGVHGVQLIGNSSTTPTFNGTAGNNSITGGGYNLTLQGAGGSYSDLTLSNATTSALNFSSTANPTAWDDASIILSSTPSPYILLVDLPTSVGVLGTTDLGYNVGSSSFTRNYVAIGSTLSNITLVENPLSLGGVGSVYRVISNITVPAGTTLTVEDGAIVKFNLGLILYVDGTLTVGDGDGLGTNSIFTSIRDDSIGGDTNGDTTTTTPAWNDWNSIRPRAGSVVDIDNATIGYSSYGLYHYNVQSTSLDITNTDFHDVYYYGLQLGLFGAQSLTMNLDTVSFTNTGVNTSYHGIYADIDTSATLSGTWDNVTLNDIGGSGIYIDDSSTNTVDPTISGLNIGDSGTVGVHGVQLIGNTTTSPIFDGTAGTNAITGGRYNLTLQGAGGNYSNLTLSSATTSALYFSTSANPTAWDDASIILTNTPAPYTLLIDLPTSVGLLGTGSIDLGYNVGGSSFTRNYVAIGSTLSNLTLVENPINLGGVGSVYRVISNITVPPGITLTVEDGAIVKFDPGLLLYVDGTLTAGDGDGLGTNSVFTSIRDDSIGGDSNGDTTTTTAAWNDWNSIRPRAGSVVDIDNATIGYSSYGLYHYNVQSTSLDISNTDFHDVYYYGIEIGLFSAQTLTMNLDTVSFTDTGVNTSYHGIYANVDTTATLGGNWNNVTLNDIGGSGIYIDDSSSGAVDPIISGLTIGDSGTVGVHGVQLIGDATTTPIFNGTASTNQILAGSYNITLQGVAGSYSDLTLDGATIASVYFSDSAAPSLWNTVTISNSPSPYNLVAMNIPVGVSYTAGPGLNETYIRFLGPLTADITLGSDPLNVSTGSGLADDPTVSYWYSPNTLRVNSGVTLTIDPGTLMKFAEATYLQVESGGTLEIDPLNVGNEVFLTSFSDDVVNNPALSSAVNNDWHGIYFRTGSNGGNINNLSNWYAYYGVNFENMATDPVFNNIEIHYSLFGLYFNSNGAIAPGFTNTFINEASNRSIDFRNSGNINPSFAGINRISTTLAGGSVCIYNNSSSPNILISGWTMDGCQYGIDTRQSGTYINNLIRNASVNGMYINTSSAITVRNNRFVNNGTYGSSYGGGIRVAAIGATSIIENNLIRHNEGYRGGGIYFDGGLIDATVRNNLIVENRVNENGGGIYIYDNTDLLFNNNTLAGNSVAGASKSGTGLYINDFTNNVTYNYNIFANNRDDDSVENLFDASVGSSEDYNIEDADSGVLSGNSLPNAVFSFTEGWYLTAGSTDAIDGGDVTSASLGLDTFYTETATTDSGLIDLGYHYAVGSIAVSAGNSTVTPASVIVSFSEVTTFTVTPRDVGTAVIGEGLNVSVGAANFQANVGSVTDLGDGTYQFTYTAGTTDQDDTLTITVNGVPLTTQPFIDWP